MSGRDPSGEVGEAVGGLDEEEEEDVEEEKRERERNRRRMEVISSPGAEGI